MDNGVGDERPKEQRGGSAADDREVVSPDSVVDRKRKEREDDPDGERATHRGARPETPRREQPAEPEDDEHLADRPRGDGPGDAEAERGGARGRGALEGSHEEERDEREGDGEQRVARELVEEEDVPRIREEGSGRREPRGRPEASGDAVPRNDREGVERRRRELADDRAGLQQDTRYERRPGRPGQQRVRKDDVGIEELRVVEEVARQVAPRPERLRDRDEGEDGERGDEHDGRREPALREALASSSDANDRAHGRHSVSLAPSDDGSGGRACYGRAPYAMSDAAPEISVVIPCLNEEEAVGKVVDQAWEGIRSSGRRGEVIVVDNASTDASAEVAADHGAIVVREERPGYGSAYLAGLAAARGQYIVMGDADETYPLRELGPFVERVDRPPHAAQLPHTSPIGNV